MSTHYRDCNVYDFYRYFGGCVFFHYTLSKYVPFELLDLDGDEDRHNRHTEAHDFEFCLTQPGGLSEIIVSGEELCTDLSWIIYRPPVEYVVASDGQSDKLYRISFEPTGSRMCKGLNAGWISYLPLLDYNADSSTMKQVITATRAGGKVFSTARSKRASFNEIVKGVANTLSVGATACTRHNIAGPVARGNAKSLVAEVVDGAREVVVPDFPTAVVAHRSRPEALVLHRGKFIGTLKRDEEDMVLCPSRVMVAEKTTRKHVLKGLDELTTRLLGDRVEWTL